MTERWDKYVKEMNEVLTFNMVDGQPAPPKIVLPKFVADRIELFREDRENGLTFFGALEFVLWMDDKKCSENYEFGGADLEKVKPTKEFKEWIGDWLLCDPRQEKIAVALLYGYDIEGEEDNGKD
jgi:hypothetical protein